VLEIVPLEARHVEDAARLACSRYADLRCAIPTLPTRWERVENLVPRISECLGSAPGVAAIEGNRLVGFVAALLVPDFRGMRTAISLEWGNGARADDRCDVYEAMYARVSSDWVDAGCLSHLFCCMGYDPALRDRWNLLGFGMLATDAMRDLSLPQGRLADIEVRRADCSDISAIMGLLHQLEEHLASSPTFLFRSETDERQEELAWLSDPANALWLAYCGDDIVGYLRQGPASNNACTIINDPGTSSITGAYTVPAFRSRGTATALLGRAISWAKESGYVRCAVDFEPMNTPARRFWLRHFDPVAFGVMRRLDDRYAAV